MPNQPQGQPRQPPRERFAPDEDQINLPNALAALRAEPAAGQHGHRQITLFHHGQSTLALYAFDAGAKLPQHQVPGPVIIQVLTGRLKIATPSQDYELAKGSILRLAPNVPHDLVAGEPTDMLLTICHENID